MTPALRDRLARTLDAASASLLARTRAPRGASPFPAGHSALALAHATLDRALPGRGHAARATHHLGRATAALARGAVDPMLYGGFTGVAWVAEHVAGARGEDLGVAIDDALAAYLDEPSWNEPFDLIGGLVGYGVYALERAPRPSAIALLERIVGHLAATAVKGARGLAWRSRSAWIAEDVRSPNDDAWNLGVAHGVPGVIALLARVHRAGVARGETARLLDGAVAWLLAHERPNSAVAAFACHAGEGVADADARAAWCYGDPGVAAALLLASRASGERAWARAAVRIGARAARRDPDTSGVVDGGLCHGAAGLAHVFHRLYVATADARFEQAAYAWLARALDLRTAHGVDAYRSYDLVRGTTPPRLAWHVDATFLTGSAGVDCALASFAEDVTRHDWAGWDRVLLLSDFDHTARPPARVDPAGDCVGAAARVSQRRPDDRDHGGRDSKAASSNRESKRTPWKRRTRRRTRS